MSEKIIEIKVPYLPNKELGRSYNIGMQLAKDWVLFLDHDVMILNPHWYDILLKIVTYLDENKIKVGWITAVTNRIACSQQKAEGIKDINSNDIYYHIKEAKRLYRLYGDKLKKAKENKPFSGFFILTNRRAWEEVGGFKEVTDGNFGHVDNDYFFRLVTHGFKQYIVPGIYCYHIWKKDKETIFNW